MKLAKIAACAALLTMVLTFTGCNVNEGVGFPKVTEGSQAWAEFQKAMGYGNGGGYQKHGEFVGELFECNVDRVFDATVRRNMSDEQGADPLTLNCSGSDKSKGRRKAAFAGETGALEWWSEDVGRLLHHPNKTGRLVRHLYNLTRHGSPPFSSLPATQYVVRSAKIK